MTIEAERLFVTWFRSGADGQDHAITDEAHALSHEQRRDAEAVCGHSVTPVSLTFPPGPRCRACERYMRARATLSDFDLRIYCPPHRRRKPSFLRRLFSQPPARSVADEAIPPSGSARATPRRPRRDPDLRRGRRAPRPKE